MVRSNPIRYGSAMQFSRTTLEELKVIIRNEIGEDITEDEAAEMGTRIVGFLRLILKPLPNEREVAEEGERSSAIAESAKGS